MNSRTVRRGTLRSTALALAAALLPLTAPSALADRLQFSAASDTPMISLTREHGMVRDVADTPLVQVFADGRVRVERPRYMIGAGVHEFSLAQDDLNALVATLAATVDLDTRAIKEARSAHQRATGERFVTLDHTVTRIDLKFDALSRNGEAARSVNQTVALANVLIDAERYDQIRELAALARAERALLELARRPLADAAKEGESND